MTTTEATQRRWGLGVGIAAAVVGVLAGIGAIGWGVYSLALDVIRSGPTAETVLLSGEPGSPVPVDPTPCEDPCFGVDHLREPVLTSTDFQRLGTPVVLDSAGTYADSTATEQNDLGLEYWDSNELTPDDCLFTASEAPAIIERGGPRDTGGTIHWLTSFENERGTSIAVRAMRFFPTADAATEHMRALHALVPGCSAYAAGGPGGWDTSVTPMPALEVLPAVAAVGWIESSGFAGRYYAVDLVRSNAVLRLTLWTDNQISEQQFRDLAQRAAADLAEWPLIVNPDSRADEPLPGFLPDETGATGPRADCAGDCFSVVQAESLVPTDAELATVGLRRTGRAGPEADSAGLALRTRQAVETTNAQCRFALGIEPVVRGNPTAGSPAETDPIIDLGQFAGGGTSVTVVARVFENPERASAYAAATDYALGLCSRQVVESRRGSGEVTTLPATIAGFDSIDDPIVTDRETEHIGWQNSGVLSDRGHDLQHGNVVVRVVIDGAPLSEQQVAALLIPMIARLEGLQSVT